jgi:hypothetical protein
MTDMKTRFKVTLLTLVLNAAGFRLGSQLTLGQSGIAVTPRAGFPVGTYTNCAQGAHNPSGNNFLRAAGFQDGARLTVEQSGTTVRSTYVDQNRLTQSLTLSAVTNTLATIMQKGQVIAGFKSLCVQGPGSAAGYPANLTVTAGALTYDAGMVFLTLSGDLRSDAGECGVLSQPEASFWVACENRQGAAVSPSGVDLPDAGPAPAAKLPPGPHSCQTQIETLDHINGQNEYVAGGATGTLTLTENGAKVSVRYSGDASLSGTLHFKARTSTNSSAEPGQTLMAPCMGTGRPTRTAEMLRLASGSLTMIDSTLFLSFAGSMADNSSCPGAQVAGSLICSK